MQKMISLGPEVILEVGPGKVLSGLLRRISREVPTANVEDGETWEKAKGLL
jgi:[acyl-carrier-protein] S-malonyltransferase